MRFKLLLLTLLISTLSIAQSDLTNDNLKGKVKSLDKKSYRTNNSGKKLTKKDLSFEAITTFNEDGYLVSSLARYTTKILGVGKWRKSEFKMDDENRVVSSKFKKGDEIFQTIENKYAGLKMERLVLNEKGETIRKEQFSYGKDDEVLEKIIFSNDGTVKSREVNKYNSKGKLIESKNYKGENLFYTITTTYPTANSEQTKKEMADGNFTTLNYFEYDDKKNLTLYKDMDSKGNLVSKTINTYNDKGDLILKRKYNDKGEEEEHNYMKYEYEYDSKGNWVKKTEFLFNGNTLDFSERKIEYYK